MCGVRSRLSSARCLHHRHGLKTGQNRENRAVWPSRPVTGGTSTNTAQRSAPRDSNDTCRTYTTHSEQFSAEYKYLPLKTLGAKRFSRIYVCANRKADLCMCAGLHKRRSYMQSAYPSLLQTTHAGRNSVSDQEGK